MYYLLWSGMHKAWWRGRGEGYANDIREAGWFTETAALRHEEMSQPRGPQERTVAVAAERLATIYIESQGVNL